MKLVRWPTLIPWVPSFLCYDIFLLKNNSIQIFFVCFYCHCIFLIAPRYHVHHRDKRLYQKIQVGQQVLCCSLFNGACNKCSLPLSIVVFIGLYISKLHNLCIVIMHFQSVFIFLWIRRCQKQESQSDVLAKIIGNSKHDIIYSLVKKCSIFNYGEVLNISRKLMDQDYI